MKKIILTLLTSALTMNVGAQQLIKNLQRFREFDKHMVMNREISDYEIDLTGFAKGMYYLNVDSENTH